MTPLQYQLRFSVTETHIQQGQRHSAHANPIALALQETYPDAIFHMGSWHLDLYSKDGAYIGHYRLSRAIRRFIHKYNNVKTRGTIYPQRFWTWLEYPKLE